MIDMEKLERECDYNTKLAVTGWVFEHILAHAREGGTYRHLIYGRLGFETKAYNFLYHKGGMDISNEFDISRVNEIRKIVKEHKIAALKEVLDLCDVPDCFEDQISGWPSDEGYRRTCRRHDGQPKAR